MNKIEDNIDDLSFNIWNDITDVYDEDDDPTILIIDDTANSLRHYYREIITG